MKRVRCIICQSRDVDQNDPQAKWAQMCPPCWEKMQQQAGRYSSPGTQKNVQELATAGK